MITQRQIKKIRMRLNKRVDLIHQELGRLNERIPTVPDKYLLPAAITQRQQDIKQRDWLWNVYVNLRALRDDLDQAKSEAEQERIREEIIAWLGRNYKVSKKSKPDWTYKPDCQYCEWHKEGECSVRDKADTNENDAENCRAFLVNDKMVNYAGGNEQ